MRVRLCAALALLAPPILSGCFPRDTPSDAGPNGGCVGVCSADGSVGGDGGSNGGVRTISLAELRATAPIGEHVRIADVLIVGVGQVRLGCGSGVTGTRADFWVADPADPRAVLWVEKYCDNPPADYVPTLGQTVTLEGFVDRSPASTDRSAGRLQLRDDFGRSNAPLVISASNQPLRAPAETALDAGVSGRVFLAGPLTITRTDPPALERFHLGAEAGFDGYEVTGGVLVDDSYLRALAEAPDLGPDPVFTDAGPSTGSDGGSTQPDGGPSPTVDAGLSDAGTTQRPFCDWRALVVSDGGSVTFPDGLHGIWDTYAHAPCVDGGTLADGGAYCATRGTVTAYVPSSDAGYIRVLYPLRCADAVGRYDAGY